MIKLTNKHLSLPLLQMTDYSYDSGISCLIRVGNLSAAVTGVSHSVSVLVKLVWVLDSLTVIQEIFNTCRMKIII